jgi:hypothetical protein
MIAIPIPSTAAAPTARRTVSPVRLARRRIKAAKVSPRTQPIFAPLNVSAWVTLVAVWFVARIGYFMSSSVQWVELDGGMIRTRQLLTRKLVERPVADIGDARPLRSEAMGPLENALMDALLKTTNREYEIRFRDGTRLGLVRGEIAGLDQFLGALAAELARRREGDRIE